ncbi:YARHG domain-containing protein [Aquimarina longa]|uniref:YARHG domain-containing protein n=1 Tax=Aquimarina longa TaxID=1080221 RepID=UPI0007864FF7|nr:YARHG domain-containing protein [Aquimarina longa]
MQKVLLLIFIWFFWFCKGQTESKPETSVATFKYLSDKELQSKSAEELRFLRNEVYARKGYVFKSNELNAYFKNKAWYKEDSNKDINTLKFTNQESNYINKIRYLEENKNKKNETDTSTKCLNYLVKKKSNFYPLNQKKLDSDENYETLKQLDYESESRTEIEKIMFDGGLVFDINCLGNIKYKIVSYYKNLKNHFVQLAIINNTKIEFMRLYGSTMGEDGDSLVDGYHDIDFKLDHDNLEIYKTYYIFDPDGDSPFAKKLVRKETEKYKLTDQGLVEQ